MDKPWTNLVQTLDKYWTFVQNLSNVCPTNHCTRAPKNVKKFKTCLSDHTPLNGKTCWCSVTPSHGQGTENNPCLLPASVQSANYSIGVSGTKRGGKRLREAISPQIGRNMQGMRCNVPACFSTSAASRIRGVISYFPMRYLQKGTRSETPNQKNRLQESSQA